MEKKLLNTCNIVLRQLLRRSPKIIYQSNQLAERWFNMKLFKKPNELVRSPFCLKKVPFRSPFLGNMGPLWVPFLKTSCPPQFLEHCRAGIVRRLYTMVNNRLTIPALVSSPVFVHDIRSANQRRAFRQPCNGNKQDHS